MLEDTAKRLPVGRVGTPESLAEVYLFLMKSVNLSLSSFTASLTDLQTDVTLSLASASKLTGATNLYDFKQIHKPLDFLVIPFALR